MDSKLILIEGLPGSGKSTTARLVHEILMQKGIESELFCEGDLDHPADYESVAFLRMTSGIVCWKNTDHLKTKLSKKLSGR